MPGRRVLALDPGLDAVGWSIFTLPPYAFPTLGDYAGLLVASGAAVSPPPKRAERLPDYLGIPLRVGELVHQIEAAAVLLGPEGLVVIETPAMFGPYASRGSDRGAKALGMARGMAGLWYAIGRLEGHFRSRGHVVFSRPATVRKEETARTVLTLWPTLPTAKTGPAEDQRDAVGLGLRFAIHYHQRQPGGLHDPRP